MMLHGRSSPSDREMHDWAEAIAIGGSRADPGHYVRGSMLARIFQRAAFIETSLPFVGRWSAFVQPLPIIEYCPMKGVHVVPAMVRQ